MPICQMQTNYKFKEEERKEFLSEFTKELASILEKPLPAVMVMLTDSHMYMNESDDTVVFAEFRYVRSFESPEEKAEWLEMFADRMLALIQKYTKVNPYRIYMQFTEMPRDGAWRYIPKNKQLLIFVT